MDKVTNKEILERTARAAIYKKIMIRKNLRWTGHLMRMSPDRLYTKAGSLLSTVFWSQKERAPSSPVQGYHQEKPEAERHKDRPMDITLTAEKNGEQ